MIRTASGRVHGATAALVVLAAFGLAVAGPARADGALRVADLVRFLGAGVSEHTILLEIQGRGVAEAALRTAGASETVIEAVRGAAPPRLPASRAATGPAGAGRPTFAADTRTVRVPVSVLDRAGHPVLDLEQKAFRVVDDGRRQAITLFSRERRPLRLALALDLSRSMDDKIRQVEEALRHFIDLLEPADEICVLTFSDRVRVRQDFTADRALLERTLDELDTSGGTALYDAAFQALQRVAAGPAESKAVVLVTDGVDTASAIAFKDLRETARRAEVPVFSIGLDVDRRLDYGSSPRPGGHGAGRGGGPGGHGGFPGGGPPGGGGGWGGGGFPGGGRARSRPATFDAKPLTDLAEDTGATAEIVKGFGHYTPGSDEPPGRAKLQAAVESIASILRHRYLLGYEPPPSAPQQWRTIRVEVDRGDATARARKGYYGGD